MLRRAGTAPPQEGKGTGYRFAGWELNLRTRRLTSPAGNPVALTIGEFSLLTALLNSPQQVLSRDQLLTATRLHDEEVFDRSIDVQILRLRRKLEIDSSTPELIKTERGVGLRLCRFSASLLTARAGHRLESESSRQLEGERRHQTDDCVRPLPAAMPAAGAVMASMTPAGGVTSPTMALSTTTRRRQVVDAIFPRDRHDERRERVAPEVVEQIARISQNVNAWPPSRARARPRREPAGSGATQDREPGSGI